MTGWERVFEAAYWSIVFAVVAWFVHELWPLGLLMIPLGAFSIQLKRWELERWRDE